MSAGAGLSIPAGYLKSYAHTGPSELVALERMLGRGVTSLRADVSYAVNSDSTDIGIHERTSFTTVNISIVYHFVGATPHLYVLAGGGWFRQHYTNDDPYDTPAPARNQFGIEVGEGITVRIGRINTFVEGRVATSFGPDRLEFYPLTIGVRF